MAEPKGQSRVPMTRLKMRLAIISLPGPPRIMGGRYVPAVSTNTSRQPALTPGRLRGRVTSLKACHSLQPMLLAASRRFLSIPSRLTNMFKIIKGRRNWISPMSTAASLYSRDRGWEMMPIFRSRWFKNPVVPRILIQLMVRMMKLIQKGSRTRSISACLNLDVLR